MNGEETVRAVNRERQESTVQSARPVAVDHIFINAISKEAEKCPDIKEKPWNTCWDFESERGCWKGAHCKWVHSSEVTFPVPPSEEARNGWDYERVGKIYAEDWRERQHAPLMPPVDEQDLFYSEPSVFNFDPDTQRFVPNIETRTPSPDLENGKKALFFITKKCSQTACERDELESSRRDPPVAKLTLKTQVLSDSVNPEIQMTQICKKEKSTEVQKTIQNTPEKIDKGKGTECRIDYIGPKTPVRKASKVSMRADLAEVTSLMTPPSASKGTIFKTPERISNCNRTSGADVGNVSMFMSFKHKSPSFQSSGDWNDACGLSPIKTPIFKKLPMPPLVTDRWVPPLTPPNRCSASTPNRCSASTCSTKGTNSREDDLQSMGRTNWDKCSESIASYMSSNSRETEGSEAALRVTPAFPTSLVDSTSKQIPRPRISSHQMAVKNGLSPRGRHAKVDTAQTGCLTNMCVDGRTSSGSSKRSITDFKKNLVMEQSTDQSIATPDPSRATSIQKKSGRKKYAFINSVESNCKTVNQAGERYFCDERGIQLEKMTPKSSSMVFPYPLEVSRVTPTKGLSSRSLGSCLRSKLRMNDMVSGVNAHPVGRGFNLEGFQAFATFPRSNENFLEETNPNYGQRESVEERDRCRGVLRRGKPRILSPH